MNLWYYWIDSFSHRHTNRTTWAAVSVSPLTNQEVCYWLTVNTAQENKSIMLCDFMSMQTAEHVVQRSRMFVTVTCLKSQEESIATVSDFLIWQIAGWIWNAMWEYTIMREGLFKQEKFGHTIHGNDSEELDDGLNSIEEYTLSTTPQSKLEQQDGLYC